MAAPVPQMQPPLPQRMSRWWLWLIIIVLAVLIIAGGAWAWYFYYGPGAEAPESVPVTEEVTEVVPEVQTIYYITTEDDASQQVRRVAVDGTGDTLVTTLTDAVSWDVSLIGDLAYALTDGSVTILSGSTSTLVVAATGGLPATVHFSLDGVTLYYSTTTVVSGSTFESAIHAYDRSVSTTATLLTRELTGRFLHILNVYGVDADEFVLFRELLDASEGPLYLNGSERLNVATRAVAEFSLPGNVSDLSFSPDAATAAFTTEALGPDGSVTSSTVGLLNLGSSAVTLLLENTDGTVAYSSPAWLDEDTVAFVEGQGDLVQEFLALPTGTTQALKSITRTGTQGTILAAAAEARDVRTAAGATLVLEASPHDSFTPVYSIVTVADGSLIVIGTTGGTSGQWFPHIEHIPGV